MNNHNWVQILVADTEEYGFNAVHWCYKCGSIKYTSDELVEYFTTTSNPIAVTTKDGALLPGLLDEPKCK